MVCKGCSNGIVGDRYRLVAEWPFCETCFDRLQQPGAAAKRDAHVPERATKAAVNLFAEPLRKLLAQEEAERAAAERAAAEEASAARVPEPIEPVGVAGKKTCTACGRRLIEPGGYKMLDGRPFCPACAHAAAAHAETVVVTASTPPPADASKSSCDACERPLVNPPAEDAVEGFFLCAPCRTVDLATALIVARARHRQRLSALARQVAGEETD